MKVTVDLSPSELDEIRSFTGESKKGPAIRKMVIGALMLKRREKLSLKFLSGEWGVDLAGYETARAADRHAAQRRATKMEKIMATLIDTSLWIDFTRARSPQPLKQFIAPYILHPAAHLAEPITFEVLRHATPQEAKLLTQQFETFPTLPTPADLWTSAAHLGQACRKNGVNAASLDLLIAALTLTHDATLITFDEDFQNIAKHSDLKVKCLTRPT